MLAWLHETPKTKGMANVGKQQRISLQKFLIGHVPDRGGRPQEQVCFIEFSLEKY